MAANPESMWEQCGGNVLHYEITLIGFDGGSDDTDDRIITVGAKMESDELADLFDQHLIADTVSEISGYPRNIDVDFRLPDEIDGLKERIREVLKPKRIDRCEGLVINAPEFFVDPEFRAWLNNGEPKFTWHKGGEPGEWSDVVVLVDPGLGGEGADSDMPEHIWEQIVEACRQHIGRRRDSHHYMVRLTNLR